MKTFINHDIPKLSRIEENGIRLYSTPDGKKYPSVTTITSTLNIEAIEAWRKAVGTSEAETTSKRASMRGTAIHSLCEDYLKTGEVKIDNIFDKAMFKTIQPVLEYSIDNIHALETPLYSHFLKVAGTVDCIAEYQQKLSTIDFKTSSRLKYRDEVEHYFMQTSAYCVCFEELTGIPINRMVLIIAVDQDNPQIFIGRRDDYIHGFIKLRKEYKINNGV